MRIYMASVVAILTLIFIPGSAFAHSSTHEASGFLAGMLHTLGGLDHVLVMVAIGIWSVQLSGKASCIIPAVFISLLIIGCLSGVAGIEIVFVEAGILASAVVLSVLIATDTRLSLASGVWVVSVFALFHGSVHGAEMSRAAAVLPTITGFALATTLLISAGSISAKALKKTLSESAVRVMGGVLALASMYLAVV